MDTFSGGGRSVKQESDGDSSGSPAVRSSAGGMEAENLMDMQQQLQQLLTAGGSNNAALLSQLHLLQASGSPNAAASSLPWNLMSQYQMMLLAGQNILGEDGQVLVMPQGLDGTGKESGRSSASNVTAQQQLIDAASILQQQLNAAALASNEQALLAQITAQSAGTASVDQLVKQQQQQQQQHLPQQQNASKPSPPRPPKKPLTPYMMFSKAIWPQVKAANQHLSSVTEIGAIIGGLWRDLGAAEKLHYNEQFSKDKIRYDEEMRTYLKTNGLHPSDLIKARKKKDVSRPAHQISSPAAVTAGHQAARTPAASNGGQQAGLHNDGQLRGGNAESLPNFSQAWPGQSVQQILAQVGLAGQVYANSDGTISVDNANLASLLALQPQLLQQAQLLQEQQQQQAAKESAEKDSWQMEQHSSTPHSNGAAASNGSASNAEDSTQYTEYYTLNAQGLLVRHEGPPPSVANANELLSRISQLENDILIVQSALVEKTQENLRLAEELRGAFRLVSESRLQQHQTVASVGVDGVLAVSTAANATSTG